MTERKRKIKENLLIGMRESKRIKSSCFSVCKRVYWTFVIESIIRDRNEFQIVFPGMYFESFGKRLLDWIRYFVDYFKYWYIQKFKYGFKNFRKNCEYLKKYGIDCKPQEPIHLKHSMSPNESFLYAYLERNGLKIVRESFDRYNMVYDVELVYSSDLGDKGCICTSQKS